ncbi:uncharacterized protein GIQ15_04576 [Arthroderma uncinatum]|uniref:uncharacterized protein n=1 Tax=Arthroderma uncinatum TaxID=74035 RepID=UPI00144A5E63|nr:uncharacterized protein GIQ15_04576 [Arthroderma uncinatum]KAF3481817.1 hypothetical protein GIQ15_04576 [Arthroderma uncinatum]
MASSCCWRCVSHVRPAYPSRTLALPSQSASLLRTPTTASPFHTSATLNAAAPKKGKGGPPGPKFRESRTTRVVRKGKTGRPARRTPEERKALSHRIVLSNNNALEVTGMQDLSVANMSDPEFRAQVVGLPMNLVDRLRAVDAFKRSQGWGLFRRPCTVVRKETVQLGELIEQIHSRDNGSEAVMSLVTGGRRTGKSVHLLQATTMAFLKNWVVVTIPDAWDLVNGTTAYAPLPSSDPIKYFQKDAVAKLLKRMAEGNEEVLSQLHVSRAHPNVKDPETSLFELAHIGIQQPEISWSIFRSLWSELTATGPAIDTNAAKGTRPFKARPQLLVTVDNLSHWMAKTSYYSSDYKPIHAHDLTIVEHFLSLARMEPKKALPNGGLILYAMSGSNSLTVPSLEVGIKQVAARQAGVDPSSPDYPMLYHKVDERVASLFAEAKSLGYMELRGLPKDEAAGLLRYYAQSGLMRERVDGRLVGEKWSLSSGGVVGELELLGRRLRALPITAQE